MDLRQLQALVAVAEHGTFSAAARALHTVQSNISAHIAHLERELGCTLVDRSAGRLTDEGALVVARARRVQAELEALTTDVASLGAEITGTVRLGVIASTARWLVPALLGELKARYPAIRPVIIEASTTSLAPRLVSGQLDLAVVNIPLDDPDLVVEPLFEEDLVLVAPAGHPLAREREVTVEALSKHPLLIAARGSGMRDELDEEAARAGVTLSVAAEVDGVPLLAALAFQGIGPALVPTTAVPPERARDGSWVVVAVKGLPARRVALARRRRGLLTAPAHAASLTVRDVVVDGAARQAAVRLIRSGER